MKVTAWITTLVSLALCSTALADDEGPRTGYYKTKMTVAQIVGAENTAAMSSVFSPDDEVSWQIYVPKTYDPKKPAGVIVFISPSESWGGSRRVYNSVLDRYNLIWAGITGAGDKQPVNERLMKAIMTPTMLAQQYSLDPARIFIGGFSGGAPVAMILSTGKPELFRGGLFVGGAVFWDDNVPPKLDQIKRNRFVFVAGSNDPALRTVRRTAVAYKDAGVTDSLLIVMQNHKQEMPGPKYLEQAVAWLLGEQLPE